MESTRNLGKLMLKRPKGDSATIVLQYPKHQADRMRANVAAIQFDDRQAPLSMLAKRSIDTYLDALEIARIHDKARYDGEMVALRRMLTKTASPAKKRKSPAA